jgi:hypothetical protein
MAGLRVPDHGQRHDGVGGVRYRRARDAVDLRAAGWRGEGELRAAPLRARAGGPGGLHVRAGDVPVHRLGPLPGPPPVQRPGVPRHARRRRRRDAGRAALDGALEGAAEASRGQGGHGRSGDLQVSPGGEGAAQCKSTMRPC